jgi:hypothetical protein
MILFVLGNFLSEGLLAASFRTKTCQQQAKATPVLQELDTQVNNQSVAQPVEAINKQT